MRKNCIGLGRRSLFTPRSPGRRWFAWRPRRAPTSARGLRIALPAFLALGLALRAAGQDGAPRERIRFLDGRTEMCEVVSADSDGPTLRLSGIPQPVRFRWWQLSSEDAARLRDAQLGKPAVARESSFLVPGLRVRTTDDRVYEGVLAEGAPPGQLWLKNSEGKFVVPVDTIVSRDPIQVDLARAYAPDEVVGILVGRIKPCTAEDYDLLGLQLLRAKLQARAVAAFRVAELLRHPESPEGRMVLELVKLREQMDDLAVRKAVFQVEEQALAGQYDAAIAQLGVVEKLLSSRPEALEELRRVRTQLEESRGLARDERIVAEGYREAEARLKGKAMDRGVSFRDARAWAEEKLPIELLEHLRMKFNFSPDDPTVRRIWEGRPSDAMLKHAYGSSSWVVLQPELRPVQEWWASADDRTRYDLLKGLYIEKNLVVLRTETKSCGVCGGLGVLEQSDGRTEVCPGCLGLKGSRILIYR